MDKKKQKTILIAGYYGFGNTGDEAILSTMLTDLNMQGVNFEFIVLSGNPRETIHQHHVRSIHWLDVAAILDACQESDLIILGGGGLFHDYWGVFEDDVLTHNHSGISFYSELPLLAKLNNKPCMLYGVGVGPLFYNAGKQLTKLSFENADVATVRDAPSKSLVQDLGANIKQVHVTADPAFNLHSDMEEARRIMGTLPINHPPQIGVCLRNWDVNVSSQKWQQEVAGALNRFVDEYDASLIFIPFQVSLPNSLTDDLAAARNVAGLIDHKERVTILEDHYSPQIIQGIIAHCDLVVGMRLHSLIFSINEGIPGIGLIYDPKVQNLLQRMKMDGLVVELSSITSSGLFNTLKKSWLTKEKLTQQILREGKKLKALASKNGSLAVHLLNTYRPSDNKIANESLYKSLILKQTRKLAQAEGTLQKRNIQFGEKDETIAILQARVTENRQAARTFLGQIEEFSQAVTSLEMQKVAREQTLVNLQTHVDENKRALASLRAHATKQKEMIDVRDEGIEWLRNELALAQGEVKRMQASRFWKIGMFYHSFRSSLAHASYPVRHPFYWLAQRHFYRPLLRRMPEPIKQFFRKLLGRTPSPELAAPFMVPPESEYVLDKLGRADFYDSLTILPNLSLQALDDQLPAVQNHKADIICFSIIDWTARYQRPQQIMSQFAAHGHRVFYISTSQFQTTETTPKVKVRIIKDNIYEISLAVKRPPDVYGELIDGENLEVAIEALKELRSLYQITEAISYVMISSWSAIAFKARALHGWQVIYDCMDEWNNFPLIKRAIIDAELQLVQKCDLLVVTSQKLYETWEIYKRPMILARNATDYQFYEQHYLPNNILPQSSRPIIGYYGAIADWFDLELMAHMAKQRPDYTFILLGGVFDVDVSQLKALPNINLLGQQPYKTMPQYLYHFDVCIIPFKVNPITEATDPVKIYEYLCGGKPVVSVALSELKPYQELLYLAADRDDFVLKLDEAVAENNPALVARRREFARQNTWDKRYQQIANGVVNVTPLVSIIIITYNNLPLTRLCLHSIIKNTKYLNYEIIVVDNHSKDGSQLFLRDFADQHTHVNIILNSTNEGFAKANNQGLAQASGEYLVLLNNDTIVSPGWVNSFLRYLHDPQVGLVGPVSNFVGNEAKLLDVSYRSWKEMEIFAIHNAMQNEGLAAEIHMLAMYCIAFRRDVYQTIGSLDENFEVGMFEDDDYSQRVRVQGYKVICAQDVFVHHFGQAAFRELILNNTYNPLFEENKQRYESKWKTKWLPHKHARLHPTHYPIRIDPPKLIDQIDKQTIDVKDEYLQKILQENIKWGEHLKVEASGEWHAWLNHPTISAHYRERGLMDALDWKQWVRQKLGGPAEKSLDLGCGAGARSLDLWSAGSSQFIEGMDVSEERVAEGERQRHELGAPGKFSVTDINMVALPQNTYDLIFSAHSFHHFLELEKIMEQVSQALTKNGLFILEEFVGPTQFQWTDLQMKYAKDLLRGLPESLRTFRDGRLKAEEGRPTPAEVMAVSPFESIRSSEILPLFEKHFEVIAIRKLGGTIQHLLYNGIIHNFHPDNREATAHIQSIIEVEDHLIESDQLPSDFMLLVGKKRT